MIHIVNRFLEGYNVHLASSSPRRKNILQHVGMTFDITPSLFEENLDKSQFHHPKDYVVENAKQKALDVLHRLISKDGKGRKFIIGCDTVVVAENKIIEKPKNCEDAFHMLMKLNELKVHDVYSGVALISSCDSHMDIHVFHEKTQVEFGDIPTDVLQQYAYTNEPLDKAGGYGIQDAGGTLVKKIDGCYYNVQGFPLYRFCDEVCKWMKN